MTDLTTTTADATQVDAGADTQGLTLAAEHHPRLAENLRADALTLHAKVDGTKTLAEATAFLDNARSALVSAIQYLEQHFDALVAKADESLVNSLFSKLPAEIEQQPQDESKPASAS